MVKQLQLPASPSDIMLIVGALGLVEGERPTHSQEHANHLANAEFDLAGGAAEGHDWVVHVGRRLTVVLNDGGACHSHGLGERPPANRGCSTGALGNTQPDVYVLLQSGHEEPTFFWSARER